MKSSFSYRPEIDGLRAVAIISVVLFHAGIFGFRGGFVGVDIFFVISGYLITSILLRDLEAGTFSLVAFWERRMRRILPILFVVMITVLGAGYYFLLFQDELLDLGQSAFAQSVFLSNVFFLRGHGYFEASADTFPLLHTWSLSVEEQFYVLFPIVLLAVFSFWRRWMFPIMSVLALVSLGVSMYLVDILPGNNFSIPFLPDFWKGTTNLTAGFYLLHSRAWELLLGSVVAISAVSIQSHWRAEAVSLCGLGAILYSVINFTSDTPFPGVMALIPTLGSAAIIVGTTSMRTSVYKLLSWRGSVWVGAISYSLYLWHWPILVFSDVLLKERTLPQTLGLIVLAVVVSWITYQFVETPFRKKVVWGRRNVIASGLASLTLVALLGLSLRYVDIQSRIPAYATDLVSESFKKNQKFRECHDVHERGECLLGVADGNTQPSFVLWGDSHAAPLLERVDTLLRENHMAGMYFSYPGCSHIVGVSSSPKVEACEKMKEAAWAYIEEHDIKTILLASGWSIYTRLGPEESRVNLIVDEDSKEVTVAESKRVFREHLTAMIETMHEAGRQVFVLKQVPFQEHLDVRKAFYMSLHDHHTSSFSPQSFQAHEEYNHFSDAFFDMLEERGLITTLNPADLLCTREAGCVAVIRDRIIYEDKGHINGLGALALEPLLRKTLSTEVPGNSFLVKEGTEVVKFGPVYGE